MTSAFEPGARHHPNQIWADGVGDAMDSLALYGVQAVCSSTESRLLSEQSSGQLK
jgi:hypothetical protein